MELLRATSVYTLKIGSEVSPEELEEMIKQLDAYPGSTSRTAAYRGVHGATLRWRSSTDDLLATDVAEQVLGSYSGPAVLSTGVGVNFRKVAEQ